MGEVMEVNGKNAVIAFGSIKTTVKLDRLERTNAQPKQADVSTKSTFISAQTQDSMYEKKLHFKQDIDVRGMRGDEALQAVTYFIDDAILVGMSRVRILHGTGNRHPAHAYPSISGNCSRSAPLCRRTYTVRRSRHHRCGLELMDN